jgi:hypothetical protein
MPIDPVMLSGLAQISVMASDPIPPDAAVAIDVTSGLPDSRSSSARDR